MSNINCKSNAYIKFKDLSSKRFPQTHCTCLHEITEIVSLLEHGLPLEIVHMTSYYVYPADITRCENYAVQTEITLIFGCTNRFGRAVKARWADDRRCRDSWYEKRISLVGDGRLGAQGDFVNCASDSMPVITRYAKHTQIADSDEDGGQRQPQNRVNSPVKRRR